jgi:hypothetical protein
MKNFTESVTINYGVCRAIFNAAEEYEEAGHHTYSEAQFNRFKMCLKNRLLEEFPEAHIVIYDSSFKAQNEVQVTKQIKSGKVLTLENVKQKVLEVGRTVFLNKVWR